MEPVELYVRNWRCISEARVRLRRMTVIKGFNASGKSSLARAAYFLAEALKRGDHEGVLTELFGTGVGGVVRRARGKPRYPVIVRAGRASLVEAWFEAWSEEDVRLLGEPPWNDAFLLPAARLNMHSEPSDGLADARLILTTLRIVRDGGLVVVEEPELCKYPLLVASLARRMVELAVEKQLTVVATTSSYDFINAVLKEVERGAIDADQVTMCNMTRTRGWAEGGEVKVYSDGTTEEMPGLPKVIERLF